jgi:hypothetical protein
MVAGGTVKYPEGSREAVVKPGQRAAAALFLTLGLAISGAAVAQERYSRESTIRLIQGANEECRREFPSAIKQAVARAACENHNMELLRPSMPYPDLMDQELTYNLVLAEKVQNGKITMIEREAAAAQFHSQMIAEQQRRGLAQRAVTAQESAANRAAQSNGGAGGSSEPMYVPPGSDAPVLQNILPQVTHCQSVRAGLGMVQTVCR